MGFEGLDLGLVIVYVDDVKRAADFYERVLGLRKRYYMDTEDGGYAEFGTALGGAGRDAGSTRLAFASSKERSRIAPSAGGQPAQTVQLRFVHHDVEGVFKAACEAGAKPLGSPAPSQPWGSMLARFEDPNGLLISVVDRLTPREQAYRLMELAGPEALDVLTSRIQPMSEVTTERLRAAELRVPAEHRAKLQDFVGQLTDERLAELFGDPAMLAAESALISRL